MAFIKADIKIPEAERTIPTYLYFPTDLPAAVGNEVRGVVTLLHGLSNTGADWMMMSAAPRYAADNGYILVAPCADNSWYTDMAFGSPFYTIVTELLPAALQRIFHIPTRREQNYIAGLSMGGYGALRIGLSHPERYAAIGSFSGSLDIAAMAGAAQAGQPFIRTYMAPVLGADFALPEEGDLFHLARHTAKLPAEQQPRIFCTCGSQDVGAAEILAQNRHFAQEAGALPLDFEYREWDGLHEWNFWDRSLAEFIGFLQNSDYGARKRADWGG